MDWFFNLPLYLQVPLTLISLPLVLGILIGLSRTILEALFTLIYIAIAHTIHHTEWALKKIWYKIKTIHYLLPNKPTQSPAPIKKIEYDYKPNPKFMTANEKRFFYALYNAFSEDYHIMANVRVADVITPAASKLEWQFLFNKIKAKHFDFILLDKNKTADLSIICALELDDSSHERTDRKKRDEFLNQACKSADICLIRYKKYATFYNPDEVKQHVLKYLNLCQQEDKKAS